MKLSCRLIGKAAAVLLFFAVTSRVRAQSDSVPPPPSGAGVMFERLGPGPMPFDALGFVGFERGLPGKTVTGAPFSASFSTRMTQTLSDGNHVAHGTTGTIARDSQGRTRRDMTLPAIGPYATSGQAAPRAVLINDPVAGAHYVLHPNEKTADKMQFHAHHGQGRGEQKWKKGNDNVTTTPLGTQTINGVSAEGTRVTRTIPAGEMGNEKPILIVTERWRSPDLQIDVMVKRTDPLRGDSVIQLTGIQRQEPDASLFQVPSDYTVQQGSGHGPRMQQPEP
jgi:hypothetical protein